MSDKKNKKDCAIMRDILPSYADGLTSDVSNRIIDEHLVECDECRGIFEQIKENSRERTEKIRKEEKAYLRHINVKRKRPMIFGALLICLALTLMYLFIPGIMGDKSLKRADRESLISQIEASEELSYEDVLGGKWFADAVIYGVKRDGNSLKIYADLSTGEYIRFGDKAYDVSGSTGACVIYAKMENGNIKLEDIKYPSDGEMYSESIRELFPLRYYLRMSLHDNFTGHNTYRESALKRKAEKEFGVEVSEDLFEINEEEMRYEIHRVVNDGSTGAGDFETELVEEGKL